MTPTQAAIGLGTTLSYSNASAGTYTVLAEVTDIKPAKRVMTPVEVERYDNNTATVELIPGWTKPGEIEATLNYLPTQSTALAALFGVLAYYKITKPDTKGYAYQGIMTENGEATPLKAAMTTDVKIAVSGVATTF